MLTRRALLMTASALALTGPAHAAPVAVTDICDKSPLKTLPTNVTVKT